MIATVRGFSHLAVIVASAAFLGGCSSSSTPAGKDPFGDAMTQSQYAALKLGDDEQTIVNRQQQSGRPEGIVAARFVRLFSRHSDAVSCTYWEIAGGTRMLARLCFSSPDGKLVQKLERLRA